MQKEDCFYFGKVIKTHGIKGEVSIRIDADSPSAYRGIDMMLIEINNKLIPYFVSLLNLNVAKAYVGLVDVNTIEKALELCGKDIYLPLEWLPKLSGNKFYFHEVQGFQLVDAAFGLVGKIEKVLEYPNQAVFQVYNSGKEVLIPIHDEVIIKVDRRKKIIEVKAPEGLIEMYLSN
jgi:16S rRNA processing protein RimM